MDFRIRATLSSIDEAFLSLLRVKPLNQITIKELCDKAGIDRSTFYRHYRSIDDLMETTERNLLAELDVRLEKKHVTMKEVLVEVLEIIKSNSERYMVLFSENGDPVFPSRVLRIAYGHSAENLEELYPALSATKKRWLFDYVAYGLSAIWKDWIEAGMIEPVSEVACFASMLVENGARNCAAK